MSLAAAAVIALQVSALITQAISEPVVVAEQVVQPVQAGGAARQLGGMDVAVCPEGGLVGVGAGVPVGQREQPDVAALEALADGAQRQQIGPRRGVVVQQPRQLGMAVELVETRDGDVGHGGARVSG